MTLALHGIGVSRGFALGRVYLLTRGKPEVIEYAIPRPYVAEEVERFEHAVAEAKAQLKAVRARIPDNVPADITSFIDTHLLMLEDSSLTVAPATLIRERQCNAEWALKTQRDRLIRVFDAMNDPYLRTRRDDVDHVVDRILRVLVSAEDEAASAQGDGRLKGRVIVADDLTPADTILMQHQGITAFVTEHGGPLSHTAILARNLRIPAVVGIRHARSSLRDDETVIVDGEQGVVLSAEDDLVVAHYRHRQRASRREQALLGKLKTAPAVTRDGVKVALHANIELPGETQLALEGGATGVGLYRTEFLYMNRVDAPEEEEHLESYRQVVGALDGHTVTIRTLDLGADKQVDGGGGSGPIATNPALGLRAIRLCLHDLALFRPQLRAILRASALGPVRMMIPMLSSLHEVRQVLRLVEETKQALRDEGHAFDPRMPVGGMVEVPAAAVSARLFSRLLGFLSIGTNDLIQYTLAIDRIDEQVNYLYDPLHPAVLQLIFSTIQAGQQQGIPVSMCGEMAGDPRYARLLLGLELTEFSMHPSAILEIKKIIRDSHAGELRDLARRVLNCTDPDEFPELMSLLAH